MKIVLANRMKNMLLYAKHLKELKMDEFDKIREISEDLTHRREPTFTQFNQTTQQNTQASHTNHPTEHPHTETVGNNYAQTSPAVANFLKQAPENPTGADNGYKFTGTFNDKIDFIQVDPVVEKPFSSMKLHLIGISVFAGILGIVLAGFFFFNAESDNIDEVVTITTAPEVIKESPAQAGGMNIPDQDKLVYNRIRSDNVTTKVESLFPEPEKPVMPQILSIEDNTPEEKFVNMDNVKPVNPLDEPAKPIVAKKKEIPAPIEAVKSDEKPVIAPAPTPVIAVKKVETPAPEVLPLTSEKPVKKAVAQNKPTIKEAKKSGNIWRAQLFSSNNKAAVEKAWAKIQTKHKSLLSDMSYEIESAEIKGKGTFYRLKVGQFPTREMAATLCGKLKAQKQDCVPAK